MEAFLQHVGQNNIQHIEDTVTNRRSVNEVLNKLSNSAPERVFFNSDKDFLNDFPDGNFNCWACPSRAENRFIETNVGDLVFIVPSLGGYDSGVHYLGIVKAKCPIPAFEASRVLWPTSEDSDHLYPYLFFFDTEVGFRSWGEFLKDLNYDQNFNPRGYYLRIKPNRFDQWGSSEDYLKYLRSEGNFRNLFNGEKNSPSTLTKPANTIKEKVDNFELEPIQQAVDLEEPIQPERTRVEISRIIRDTVLTRHLKTLHKNCCQICGFSIILPDGRTYSEAHHIKPLGRDHNGPDIEENILILCPNHHAACDLGAIKLVPSLLRSHPQHKVSSEFIDYHNNYVFGRK